MILGRNNDEVVEILKFLNLRHLIAPFIKMVELHRLGNIIVHKMTWKYIMRNINDDSNTRKDIEKMFISYFVTYGIVYVPKKVKSTVSKERVRKHRLIKKELGYQNISLQLLPKDYKKLKEYKRRNNLSYSDIFSVLLNGRNNLK